MSSAENKAVFLSYASQDAEAARRLAEALRAAGVEVWFDQNELVGGDAWDAKIRKQIKECALFVPIISAHTQARAEGYFRLEWRLADQRTHLMGKSRSFLLPVCIDGTRDTEADVPDSFLAVQWTRLASGETNAAFCARVRTLLAGDNGPQSAPRIYTQGDGKPPAGSSNARPAPAVSAPHRSGGRAIFGAAVVIGVAAAWLFFRDPRPAGATAPAGGEVPAAAAAIQPANARTIAVLPFENLSPEPESGFFADGMHEEVLTAVGRVSALRVIGRASVLRYADARKRNLRQIGADLGVGSVVEGSVRRSGNRVRIAVQLVDVATSRQLWADSFERELTDVFAVQSAIAGEVAGTLRATLTEDERAALGQKLTKSADAYRLYLQATAVVRALGVPNAGSMSRMDAAEALLEEAVTADPAFVLPRLLLTQLHGTRYWFGDLDPSSERMRRTEAAAAEVVRLAPGSAEARLVAGYVAYMCRNDWAAALAEFSAAEPLRPNDSEVSRWKGICLRRLGRWLEALTEFKRAAVLDPQNLQIAETLAETELLLRHYAEAQRLTDEYARRSVTSPWMVSVGAGAQFGLSGDLAVYRRSFRSDSHANVLDVRWRLALAARDLDAAEALIASRPTMTGYQNIVAEPVALYRAMLASLRGDEALGRSEAVAARQYFENAVWNPRQQATAQAGLALSCALAGDGFAARSALGRVEESLRARPDRFTEGDLRSINGVTYILIGDREAALVELQKSVAAPSGRNMPDLLRLDPFWSRLADDPRFEKILSAGQRL